MPGVDACWVIADVMIQFHVGTDLCCIEPFIRNTMGAEGYGFASYLDGKIPVPTLFLAS